MDVFLVRHGQTDGNRLHRHQFFNTPLNEQGHRQAAIVAKVVRAFNPTHLFTSPYLRALETARTIASGTSITLIQKPLFEEVHRPLFVQGLHYFHPRSLWHLLSWLLTGTKRLCPDEGESYGELVARIDEARHFLETLPADARVVIISHSVFIDFFVGHICTDTPMSFFKAFLRFAKVVAIENSSITHVRFNPHALPGTCAWDVVAFDIDAHVVT